jgi:hypothetical protein
MNANSNSNAEMSSQGSSFQKLHFDSLQDLDVVRQQFESLMNRHSDTAPSMDNQNLMTSAGRHRRQLEIDLLNSLVATDDAVDELIHLWMHEGSNKQESEALEIMSEQASHGLVDEMYALNQMCRDHPVWAEPRIRLATVYFFKGDTKAAYNMAKEAQALKPWHFEVAPLLIMIALKLRDFPAAVRFAREGLPQLNHKKKRAKWVVHAANTAQRQWREVEQKTEAILSTRHMDQNSMWQ